MELTTEVVNAMHERLMGFGFNVDGGYVRRIAEGLLRGYKPESGPAMMIQKFLKDYEIVEDEEPQDA